MGSEPCIFCSSGLKIIHQNKLALATFDSYPVTLSHSLVVPKRHISSFFELTKAEQDDCLSLLLLLKNQLLDDDASISGFNVGVNDGVDAGQSIMHCHIHLIPRRKNDVSVPTGGIRHVIPGKGDYTQDALRSS